MTLCGLVLAAFLIACQAETAKTGPVTLIAGGKSESVVVYDQSKPAEKFAVKELTEIIEGTTGIELRAFDLNSPEAKSAKKRIVIGKNALTRKLVGNTLLESLKDQESLVTSRGDDLILTGGDDWGMIYAVYDFVENEAGYRYYAPYPGGEYFQKSDTLVFSGNETITRPAFTGFRTVYTSSLMFRGGHSDFAKFSFRNRGTQIDWERYNVWEKDKESVSYANHIGLKDKYKKIVPGHALFFYVSPVDRTWNFWRGSGKPAIKGSFEEHPDYFTLNEKGKRVANAQLCFSNLELRKLFTERVIEAIETKGPGIYMVGSNDNHAGTYCFCSGCLEFQDKYNTTGGPLWDYILELCEIIEDDYPEVYIISLAYKGAKQTEIAPDNIQFPKNFIIDAALLNYDTPKESTPVEFAGGVIANNFDKYENLKKWGEITEHMSYWYYGGSAPYAIYDRIQKELQEILEAGTESVGGLGLGSMEFGDLSTYIYLRLTINPYIDAKKLVEEFCEFKYGAAAPVMISIIEELEKMRRDGVGDRTKAMFSEATYESMNFIEAEQLVRWRKDFDRMLELVEDDSIHARNVRIARTAIDCWTIMNMPKIRAEFPDEKVDAATIIARGLASVDEAIKAGMTGERKQAARRILSDMSLYANLKDDSLPVELHKYPRGKVIRHLPVQRSGNIAPLTEDVDAVAGWAMKEKITNPERSGKGGGFDFYDAFERRWVKQTRIDPEDIVPNEYHMYKLLTTSLPPRFRLVFLGLWGSSVDIMDLGRYYDPSYHERQYEYWANIKFEGPFFDPNSEAGDSYISIDQVFLVNKGAGK